MGGSSGDDEAGSEEGATGDTSSDYSGFFGTIIGSLKSLAEACTSFFRELPQTIVNNFNNLIIDIESFFSDLSYEFNNAIDDFENSFVNKISDLKEAFLNKMSEIYTYVTSIYSMIDWFRSSVSEWFRNLTTNIGNWFTSVGEWFVNLGDSITNTVSEWFNNLFQWFEDNFTIDFEEIKETYDFKTLFRTKFSFLFDVHDKVSQATGVMVFNHELLSNANELSTYSVDEIATLYSTNDVVFMDKTFEELAVIEMTLPIAGENRTYEVFNLYQPHLLEIYYVCRTILDYFLWLSLGYWVIRRIGKNLTI